jgi:hypothetical protein
MASTSDAYIKWTLLERLMAWYFILQVVSTSWYSEICTEEDYLDEKNKMLQVNNYGVTLLA